MRCDHKWHILKKKVCGFVWSFGPSRRWRWLEMVAARGETLEVEMEVTLEMAKLPCPWTPTSAVVYGREISMYVIQVTVFCTLYYCISLACVLTAQPIVSLYLSSYNRKLAYLSRSFSSIWTCGSESKSLGLHLYFSFQI